MLIHELKVHTLIEIEIYRDGSDEVTRIKTKVDSLNKYEIKAMVPEWVKVVKDITEIYVNYKEEGQFKRWSCTSKGFELSNAVTLITLLSETPAEGMNRRYAFRLPYYEDTDYICEGVKYKGRYKDLSAVGIGFYSVERHSIGDLIDFVLIDNELKIDIVGEIKRVVELQDQKYKFFYGVAIQDKDVSRFVFKKQVEMIRKKKGKN